MNKDLLPPQNGRRQFINTSLKLAGSAALLNLPHLSNAAAVFAIRKDYTVQDVIDIILKEIPGAPFKGTVDTIKSGNANNKVSGIVTTMFTTVPVIEAAAKPNGILHGVLKNANWLPYYEPGKPVMKIPTASLKEIVAHLKSSLGIEQVQVEGNLNQSCERIIMIPGAAGAEMQIGLVEKEKPDVLIVGELREWETAEYIRDSLAFGKKTSLIVLGHSQSEEPGMEWLVDWLQPKIPELKVTHIASGNAFTWI